ncbi:MAG: UDP-glucose 4-epimerase GalE [Thermincolia bacterium]
MNVLVTGGAGYIGSHTVKELLEAGYGVVTLDNLSKGHRSAVWGGEFIQGDLSDIVLLDRVFADKKIEAVIHFAADSLIGESMELPGKYFRNNISNGLNLLDTMVKHGVDKLVFSSTAAVYGEPEETPIREEALVKPINNYGLSKMMLEEILRAYDRAHGLRSVSLRYFNAAGAEPSGLIGEDHNPETHLIPLVLKTALGVREEIKVFGTDYPTPDGTCIRDYIHVADLAQAHVLGLEFLKGDGLSGVYNLGNGKGYSVREVIETARQITGREIGVVESERRVGDPAVLVASSEKIVRDLGWKPQFYKLEDIIETAWRWHKQHPEGFKEEARI